MKNVKNNLRLSCPDFTFPLLSHEKVLDLLKLLEFEAMDLGVFEDRSHHYPSRVARDPMGHAERLRGQLEDRALEVSDVFVQTGGEPSELAVNDPDAGVRGSNWTTFCAMVEFAKRLGAEHLTGLPGVSHAGVDAGVDWDLAVEETRRRVEECRQSGMIYAVEPHVGSILPDPERALRFVESVPGLTLTLDYGHFIYQGMGNEAVHPLLPHASHFHARCGADGQLQTTMEENAIDFAAILEGMERVGYQGRVCIEYVYVDWEGCNRTDNISETLRLRELLENGGVSGGGGGAR